MNRRRTLLVAVALAWLAVAPVWAAPTETIGAPGVALPEKAKGKPPSFTGQGFWHGVVSVANPHGAEAGAQILEAGGNAVDAAVAIAYALNVVEPQSAGVGGGGFMMIHIAATGETVMIDTRERAPAGDRAGERRLCGYGSLRFGELQQPSDAVSRNQSVLLPRRHDPTRGGGRHRDERAACPDLPRHCARRTGRVLHGRHR